MPAPLDHDLLTAYIDHHTHPAHWVAWWTSAPTPEAEQALRTALCSPGSDSLTDLTTPSVHLAVREAVFRCPDLRLAVESEAERVLNTLAERLASPNESS